MKLLDQVVPPAGGKCFLIHARSPPTCSGVTGLAGGPLSQTLPVSLEGLTARRDEGAIHTLHKLRDGLSGWKSGLVLQLPDKAGQGPLMLRGEVELQVNHK